MSFSEKTIQLVWEKGLPYGADSTKYLKDAAGALIIRDHYSKEGDYGWCVDHIVPISKGGKDDYENLRPMHWENNRSKGNDYPNYNSVIMAEGNKNVRQSQECTVDEDLQIKLRRLYYL